MHSYECFCNSIVQRLKFNAVNGQSPQNISMLKSLTPNRAKFWPAVTAVTIESMGMTPPELFAIPSQASLPIFDHHSVIRNGGNEWRKCALGIIVQHYWFIPPSPDIFINLQASAGLTSQASYTSRQQTYASVISQGHTPPESHGGHMIQPSDSHDQRRYNLAEEGEEEDEQPPSAHTVQSW